MKHTLKITILLVTLFGDDEEKISKILEMFRETLKVKEIKEIAYDNTYPAYKKNREAYLSRTLEVLRYLKKHGEGLIG